MGRFRIPAVGIVALVVIGPLYLRFHGGFVSTSHAQSSAETTQSEAEIEFTGFNQTSWVDALYRGDIKFLNLSRPKVVLYANGFDQFIGQERPDLHDADVATRLMRNRMRDVLGDGDGATQGLNALRQGLQTLSKMREGGAQSAMQGAMEVEELQKKGEHDAARLLVAYNKQTVARVYRGLQAFARNDTDFNEAPRVLHSQEVLDLGWYATGSLYDVAPAKQDEVGSQVTKLMRSSQKVIKCMYGDEKRLYTTYYFWYKTVPANIYDLLATDPKHPLRRLGVKAVSKAPKDEAEAKEKALAAAVD